MKEFKITPNTTTNSGWTDNHLSIDDFIKDDSTKKRIFLFMIGGSGASIMQPFLSIFADRFTDNNMSLIPIFIDRHFDSANVSQGIQSLGYYHLVCHYLVRNITISSPYLFLDDGTLFQKKSQLLPLLQKIKVTDQVFFSFSTYNRSNIALKATLTKQIKSFVNCTITNLVFLPYFSLELSSEVSDDFIKGNLEYVKEITLQENVFYAGAPRFCHYKSTAFQRNPFNFVSLLLAYSLLYSSLNLMNITGHHFTFSISDDVIKSKSFKDLIPQSELRNIIVRNDYRELIWQQLVIEDIFSLFPYQVEKDTIDSISLFLKESTDLINQLGDSISNPSLQLYLRKQNIYDYKKFWIYLKKTILGIFNKSYSKTDFLNEIKNLLEIDKVTTGNMVIHEILLAINKFIDIHWGEISKLYY